MDIHNDSYKDKELTMQNRQIFDVLNKLTQENLSYLGSEVLGELVEVVIANERNQVKGVIVEAGCALGGSAIAIASAKNKNRAFFIYDVFGMIPAPSEKDGQDVHQRYEIIASGKSKGIGEGRYYGYEENLYDKVLQAFTNFEIKVEENNIFLIKGLYEDTLHLDSPLALAHIDCDWYSSVLICLNRLEPYLVKGGTLIIDDYYAWSGCKLAVDEYFKNRKGYEFIQKSRLHIVKQ